MMSAAQRPCRSIPWISIRPALVCRDGIADEQNHVFVQNISVVVAQTVNFVHEFDDVDADVVCVCRIAPMCVQQLVACEQMRQPGCNAHAFVQSCC